MIRKHICWFFYLCCDFSWIHRCRFESLDITSTLYCIDKERNTMEDSIEIFLDFFILSFVENHDVLRILWKKNVGFLFASFFKFCCVSTCLLMMNWRKWIWKIRWHQPARVQRNIHFLHQDWTCLRLKQRFKIMTFTQKICIISIYNTNISYPTKCFVIHESH